jgi:hypothetical protein
VFNLVLIELRPFVIAIVLLTGVAPSPAAQFSELWGQQGEKYNPAGVLPDFSFAGYERGEKAIPERAAEVSVKSFGAAGDGKTDDTAAFKRAIEEAAGKVIGIPAGRYVLSDVLEIGSANTVLKGAGADKTVLVFVKSLQALRPTSAETGSGKPTTAWSWGGGLVWFKGRNPVGRALAEVEAPGAKRGDTTVPVADASQFEAGQEVAVSVKDDSEGTLVKYIFRDRPEDAKKLVGKHSYRYAAKIRETKEKTVVLDRPLRFDLRPEWSASLCAFAPVLQQSGIEDLTFEFPRQPYRAHWEEDGYNAIQFDNCAHCWARRLVIHNSDSGIYLKGFFCTVSDVVLTANRRALPKGETGHHGIEADGVDNLVTRFQFKTRFFHEVTVAHALGNVISDGSGMLLTLDHHKGAPYENLFTNLDTGEGGPDIWKSGGPPGVGLHSASGATFWNIRGKREAGLPPQGWGPAGLVFIGLKGVLRKSEQRAGWHYEPIQPGSLSPPNLHLAQLARRLGANSSASAPASQRWTTITGQSFEAKFGGMSGPNVIFILPDGRRAPYPFASLSAGSRAVVGKLAAPR